MTERSAGSVAVDQTLRLARDAIERDIAGYRVIAFGAVTCLTLIMIAVGVSQIWMPTIFFACVTLYAAGLRLFLSRFGNRPGLAIFGLFVDLTATVGTFQLTLLRGPIDDQAQNARFTTFIVGPAMVFVLLINSLRNSAVLSIAGGAIALGLFAVTVPRIAGFHPAQVSVGLIIALASAIGVGAARQARKNLDSFARLQLLRRYLPPAAVERVMREHPDEALALGGRLARVTLLSADLRGFTAMSEKLTPSEVMSQLNAYHGAMIDVIERHGGAIDKFIGDGTLVVFGLDGDERDAAASGVACAKEMLGALERHNEERAAAGKPSLRMGIAVHTGSVIAGNLGVPGRRLEFTVIGDAVNTVSRLEGQTKASGCPLIVSEATFGLLDERAGLRELAPVSLRGKESAIKAYGFGGAPSIAPPLARETG